jgi:hypothetical protein
MNHIRVVEAANHMEDGIHAADVSEELVAEALALAGTPNKPGDVEYLYGRWDDLLAVDDPLQLLKTAVNALNRVLLPTLGSPTIPA